MPEGEYKIRIPDEDIRGWMDALREGGFDFNEIDKILINLSNSFAELKLKERIEKELARGEEQYFQKTGQKLEERDKEGLRQVILEKLREQISADLK